MVWEWNGIERENEQGGELVKFQYNKVIHRWIIVPMKDTMSLRPGNTYPAPSASVDAMGAMFFVLLLLVFVLFVVLVVELVLLQVVPITLFLSFRMFRFFVL